MKADQKEVERHLQDDIELGNLLRPLLDARVQKLFDTLEANLVDRALETAIEPDATSLQFLMRLRAVRELREVIEAVAADGKIAEKRLMEFAKNG